ncbi:efflux MFS transporter YdeE [Proteus terrae]|uniref:Efflux MFS transporter YdeE n=1 Tax=Proteus terrae subsp. cibarius TaxID=626774 RepID=A0A8I0WSQ4_9GAMM|nr:efflux MFS transporter YdeE [Proteus terrae]MBG2914563.1 efflux MFS transporter YdeE [Proteus terrae subsp. cibarius]QKD69490.1 efflux MFS transporter YdeE [Proteus terrae subsp. cibarius]QKD71384.1 efflux MFS transporter YdeE [Proteus terrae subsp. cibarius]UDF27554.1 efflux MFS transporter YdeE [Proteus terrae subsp. cibarius]WCG88457.1 efflux MFS transporter YdeE [Proteus terrae]
MFSKKTRSTTALLFSSLLLTIGRGATLPFMAIYLSREYQLPVDDIGIAMSIALTTGIFFSLGFGMLADKFEKKRYMLLSIITFIFGFAAIPMVHSTVLVVIFFSVINCSYLVFSTVLKAYFSETLSVSAKPKIFSLNYTFINMGWTVGPPIGTLLLMYGTQLPFWLAAISASVPLFMIQLFVQRSKAINAGEENSVKWDPKIMLKDRALSWFVLSTFFGTLTFGSFASCISQYILVVYDAKLAESVIAVVLPVNAAIVVSLQYIVGKHVTAERLRKLMTLGTLFFMVGLLGFMFAGNNLIFWALAIAVFTLGELIYAPGEYMMIDNIAPLGMKASYFSAQSLGWLGAALNPLASGFILTSFPPVSLFAILMVICGLAWFCMIQGMNVSQKRAIAL